MIHKEYKNSFHQVSLPGTGYNPSQELGGNSDWTFSKGWAEAFLFSISSNASVRKIDYEHKIYKAVHYKKELYIQTY